VQAFSALEYVKQTVRQQVKGGKIVFIGSTLMYMSFAGWASYSPAKHALRGLADTLRSELLLYGTSVHILGAPTMKSPGYQVEMQTKPKIVAEIEGDEGHPMDEIAEKLVSSVARGVNHIAFDLITDIFRVITRGSAPHHNSFVMELVLGFFGWVGIPLWRWDVDKKIRNHADEHRRYLVEKGVISGPPGKA